MDTRRRKNRFGIASEGLQDKEERRVISEWSRRFIIDDATLNTIYLVL